MNCFTWNIFLINNSNRILLKEIHSRNPFKDSSYKYFRSLFRQGIYEGVLSIEKSLELSP